MSDSSEGKNGESPSWTMLDDSRIPKGKIAVRADARFICKRPGMTEDDLERVIKEEGASGNFNAYRIRKCASPRAFGVDEIHIVTYLQLEDDPDYPRIIGEICRKLVAEATEREKTATAEEYCKEWGGLARALKKIEKRIPAELLYGLTQNE
jgi:hypothetical protein